MHIQPPWLISDIKTPKIVIYMQTVQTAPQGCNALIRITFVMICVASVPTGKEKRMVNRIDHLTDVLQGKYYHSILLLYNAGVLTGSGPECAFRPEATITRAELSAPNTHSQKRTSSGSVSGSISSAATRGRNSRTRSNSFSAEERAVRQTTRKRSG